MPSFVQEAELQSDDGGKWRLSMRKSVSHILGKLQPMLGGDCFPAMHTLTPNRVLSLGRRRAGLAILWNHVQLGQSYDFQP